MNRTPAIPRPTTPSQASGSKTIPARNPTIPMADAPMSRNPPAASWRDAAHPFDRARLMESPTSPAPTAATAMAIRSWITRPGYPAPCLAPRGDPRHGPQTHRAAGSVPLPAVGPALPGGLSTGRQVRVGRVPDRLQGEPVRWDHGHARIPTARSQHLCRPPHRPPAVANGEQGSDHGPDLVVAEGVGLDGCHREIALCTFPPQGPKRPDGRRIVTWPAVRREVVLADQRRGGGIHGAQVERPGVPEHRTAEQRIDAVRAVTDPVRVPPPQRREPRVEPRGYDRGVSHPQVRRQHSGQPVDQRVAGRARRPPGDGLPRFLWHVDVADLTAGVNPGIRAAGDRQPRRLDPQHDAQRVLQRCLDRATAGLRGPAGEIGAVVGQVQPDTQQPAATGVGSSGLHELIERQAFFGLENPAASAASAVRNHTSATVAAYDGDSGVWYSFESSLPLTVKPSGAEPSAAGAAESGPYGPSADSADDSSGSSANVTTSALTSASAAAGASAFLAPAFLAGAFLAGAFFATFLAARRVAPSASPTTCSASGSTSSITAKGALSPLRGPILTIRV